MDLKKSPGIVFKHDLLLNIEATQFRNLLCWFSLSSSETTCNSEKCKKYEIRFMGKTTFFRWDFKTLYTRPAITVFSSNVHQFYKPNLAVLSVKRPWNRFIFPGIFFMLYEVYTLQCEYGHFFCILWLLRVPWFGLFT